MTSILNSKKPVTGKQQNMINQRIEEIAKIYYPGMTRRELMEKANITDGELRTIVRRQKLKFSIQNEKEKAIDTIKRYYKPGITRQELCDATGFNSVRVTRICQKNNLPLRDARLLSETLENQICRMIKEGKTRKEISAALNINPCVINSLVNRKHPELKKRTHVTRTNWKQVAPVVRFMIDQGMSRKEIAKTLRLPPITVSLIIKHHLPEYLNKRKYSDECINTVRTLLDEGKTRQEIADETGLTVNIVYYITARYASDSKNRRKPLVKDKDKIPDIIRLREEGKSFAEIGRIFNMKRDRAYHLYHQYGALNGDSQYSEQAS